MNVIKRLKGWKFGQITFKKVHYLIHSNIHLNQNVIMKAFLRIIGMIKRSGVSAIA